MNSRRIFQSLTNADQDFQLLLRPDGVILAANESLAHHLGQPVSQLIGVNICEKLPEESCRRMNDWIAKVLRTQKSQRFDRQLDDILLTYYLFPLLDEDGQVQSIVIFAVNVTEQQHAEDELREQEARLALVLEASSDGLWEWNVATDALYLSPPFYRMLGYEPGEFSMSFDECRNLVHPDDQHKTIWAVFHELGTNEDYSAELRMRTKAGEWRWVLCRGKVTAWDTAGKPARIIGTHTDITVQKESARQLRQYQQQLLSLNVELMKTEERERRRIAQQLHDNLSQLLAFLCMKLDWLSGTDDINGIHEALVELHGFAEEAMRATRQLTVELSPPILFEHGLEAALYELPRFFREKYELTIQIAGSLPALDQDIAVSVYQCVRELLINVLKHARTKVARILLAETAEQITVEVGDDGVGFDVTQVRIGDSFGLFSIRERLRLIGGTVKVTSAPGAGTTVVLTVPVKLHLPSLS